MRQEGRDGDLDVVVASGTADDLDWFENTAGNGSAWTEHQSDGSFDGVACIRAADVDGDGDLDLVVADEIATALTVLRQDQPGTFVSQASTGTPGTGIRTLGAADLDGDGEIDLFSTTSVFDPGLMLYWGGR